MFCDCYTDIDIHLFCDRIFMCTVGWEFYIDDICSFVLTDDNGVAF